MTCTSRRRIVFLLLLILPLLATSGAWAADGWASRNEQSAVTKPAPLTLLSRAWSLLTALWSKTGCHIDPNGRCVTAPAPAVPIQADTGCGIDPDGRCKS